MGDNSKIRKIIKTSLNEWLNEQKNYYDFLNTVSFEELPFEYKKSLIIYFYEGDVVDWSINNTIDEISKNDDLVNILINDYISVGRNKNKSFAYGLIPMQILTKEITKRMGFKTFQEYHNWYNDNTDHKDSILPIILSFDNEELIEDGWHRFHSYYKKGIKEVPAVAFM
jgi:hypothetical protein